MHFSVLISQNESFSLQLLIDSDFIVYMLIHIKLVDKVCKKLEIQFILLVKEKLIQDYDEKLVRKTIIHKILFNLMIESHKKLTVLMLIADIEHHEAILSKFWIRLIVESSFELTFWTRIVLESGCPHFQLDPSRIEHIFNSTRLDPTGNWVNSTRLAKNLSLASRGLNIENFPVFDFCITFLHYLLIESHEGKHEDRLIESHKEKHEDRLIESHDEEHEEKHEGEHEGKHEDRLIEDHDEKHKEEHEEEHEGEHEGRLIEGHDGKHKGKHKEKHGEKHEGETWRPFDFDRESWRENMVESHEEKPCRLFDQAIYIYLISCRVESNFRIELSSQASQLDPSARIQLLNSTRHFFKKISIQLDTFRVEYSIRTRILDPTRSVYSEWIKMKYYWTWNMILSYFSIN